KVRMSYAAVLMAVVLAGCQSPSEIVANKEDMLAAAGFVPKPATTPAQLASLKKLPANKIVQQVSNDQVVYLYADPMVCQCVYSGSSAAYGQYRQMMFQQNLADEQQMTASMMQEDAFDFGPWGGFWGF